MAGEVVAQIGYSGPSLFLPANPRRKASLSTWQSRELARWPVGDSLAVSGASPFVPDMGSPWLRLQLPPHGTQHADLLHYALLHTCPGELLIHGTTPGDFTFFYTEEMRDRVILFVHVIIAIAG